MSKICDLCRTPNDDDNMFCDKCGNPLVNKAESKTAAAPKTEEEAEAAEIEKAQKKSDAKLMLIPIAMVMIVLALFGLSYYKSYDQKKGAKEAVTNYLNLVKDGKYSDALQAATGNGITPEFEEAFGEFAIQLTPPMPINEELQKTKLYLSLIKDGVEKYYFINRKFPSELKELTPVIMGELPPAPKGREFAYEFDGKADNYTIYVKGNAFAECGLQENSPAISKNDNLQSPGEKKVTGKWEIKNFSIIDEQISSDRVRITVRESSQFGPKVEEREDIYTVRKNGDKWQIDRDSTTINPMTFAMAFTQMESLDGPQVPVEVSPSPGQEAAETPSPTPEPPKETKISLGMALMAFSKIAEDPQNLSLRRQYQLRKCGEMLEDIGSALDKYYRCNEGTYPLSLQWLIPGFLEKIPDNPAAQSDTFTEGYTVSESRDRFTVYSKGDYYKSLGIDTDFPQYSSVYRYINNTSDLKQKEEANPQAAKPNASPAPTCSPSSSPGAKSDASPLPSPSASPGAEASPSKSSPSPSPTASAE